MSALLLGSRSIGVFIVNSFHGIRQWVIVRTPWIFFTNGKTMGAWDQNEKIVGSKSITEIRVYIGFQASNLPLRCVWTNMLSIISENYTPLPWKLFFSSTGKKMMAGSVRLTDSSLRRCSLLGATAVTFSNGLVGSTTGPLRASNATRDAGEIGFER